MIQRVLQRAERELRRFNQDRRNARLLGELAMRQLHDRLKTRPRTPEAARSERSTTEARPRSTESSPDQWALLSAQELLDQLGFLDNEELLDLLRREQEGRNRHSVVRAIHERLSNGAS